MNEFDMLVKDLAEFTASRDRAARPAPSAALAKSEPIGWVQPFPSPARHSRPAAKKSKPKPTIVIVTETREELHARVRAGAVDILAKASDAFSAGRIGGTELVRVEASVNAVLAQIP